MQRASDYDLRRAAQISVIRGEVETYMGNAVVDGSPLHSMTELRYYYLGVTGRESEERVTEDCFLGRDEENPRQPGYYAVDIVYHDGRSAIPKPWFAVFRDQSRDMSERREKSAEGGYQDLMEEYRIMIERQKRENQDQVRRNNQLQTELDSFTAAYNNMRKAMLGLEVERDKALYDAAQMEHRMQMALDRCHDLESEASSFKPQIKMMIDGLVEKVGPEARQMFMSLAGGEEDGEQGSGKKKSPKPPWSGGGPVGAAAGEARAGDGARGGSTKTQEAKDGPKEHADLPSFDENGIATPEFLTKSLYWLFWELEVFGKFVCLTQKAEDNESPLCPWWVIRSVVFYHSGMDLGPDPIWPSDVKDADPPAPPVRADRGPSGGAAPKDRARRRTGADAEATGGSAEVVPDGDISGDDAIDLSSEGPSADGSTEVLHLDEEEEGPRGEVGEGEGGEAD